MEIDQPFESGKPADRNEVGIVGDRIEISIAEPERRFEMLKRYVGIVCQSFEIGEIVLELGAVAALF